MSALKELEPEISKLPTTNPIFSVSVDQQSWGGVTLKLSCVGKVYPTLRIDLHKKIGTNPFATLAEAFHQEYFDVMRRRFVIDVDSVKARIYAELRSWTKSFIADNGTHGPEHDLLLRWYDYYVLSGNNLEKVYFEPILSIYKYVMTHITDEDVVKHKTNAMAIFELIFQRDYKEVHLPQRHRKRRRRK